MLKKIKLVLASLFFFNQLAVAQQPINIEQLRQELIHYYETGEYEKDIQLATEPAKQYLLERINQNKTLEKPKKLAIVFDIDETVLSNYAFMKKMRFGGTITMFDKSVLKANSPAIKPTQELYELAIKNKVAVFFITGRKENIRYFTENNLKKAGFTQWSELRMKPNNYQRMSSASIFKIAQRKTIEEKGYDIVLNLGDQESDLKGGFAEKSIKLPDPFYYVP